jgi:hypothetical protein
MKKILTELFRDKLFAFLTLLIIVLFFVNRYMYLHRYEGFLYTEALDYNRFYYPDETYHVRAFERMGQDSLLIKILPESASRTYTVADKSGSYTVNGLKLKLHEGSNSYKIFPVSLKIFDTLRLQIEFVPAENSLKIELCNIPIFDHNLLPLSEWTRLPSAITEKEIAEVKHILKAEVGISDTQNTLEKVTRIGSFLSNKLNVKKGAGAETIKALTPMQQYKAVCKNEAKPDCAIYSDIYFLFANCAGVATRRIGVAGWNNYFITSGHVLNESYFPEQQKWGLIDLTYKKLLVFNRRNTVLNVIDLMSMNRMDVFGGARVLSLNDQGKIDTVKYREHNLSEQEYFKADVQIYSIYPDIKDDMNFKESFKEYLGTKSHYGKYYANTMMVDNSKHYLKLHVFQLSLIVFGLWFLYFLFKTALFFRRSYSQENIQ